MKTKKRKLYIVPAVLVLVYILSFTVYASETDNTLVVNSVDNTQEMEMRERMTGRLYIPSLDINVAVFDVSGESVSVKQQIVDRKDSAIYFLKNGASIIGDHLVYPFGAIKYAREYETAAYIQTGTSVDAYICIATGIASGGGYKDTETGVFIGDMQYGAEAAFFTVTCHEEDDFYYYAVWAYCGSVNLLSE